MGVRVTFVDVGELSRLEDAIEERTRLLYMESPASLTFDVIDLQEVARVGKARGIVTATDNSWATPLFHKPLDVGIDLSVHSGTKYISGHSDLLLGLVAGRRPHVARVRRQATLLGATLSPADAFLALRGLRTLPLRLQRHQDSALQLARRLLVRDEVVDVLHPALPFFPSHGLWKRQFTGSSGLFSFRLRGDARRFADALELFALGFSWGGFESLVLPQAIHARVQPKKKTRRDIPDDLLRLSVGLEDPGDLWKDLQRGFHAIADAP
jgi:cystathionine beta-lyase